MNILKFTTIISLAVIASSGFAQQVNIVTKGDYMPKKKVRQSTILNPRMDTSQLKFVAKFNVIGIDNMADLSELYTMMKKEATKLGANCYKLSGFRLDSSGIPTMTFDTYFASKRLFKQNEAYYDKNEVYVFADLKPSDKTFSLLVNEEKKVFKAGTFLKLDINEGGELSLCLGGPYPMRTFTYDNNRSPTYFKIKSSIYNGISVPFSFNSGFIEYSQDNGELLIQILKQTN